MKYLDKRGRSWNNPLAAAFKNISDKADDFIRSKMPSYEDTINEDEHLYDAMKDVSTDVMRSGNNDNTKKSMDTSQLSGPDNIVETLGEEDVLNPKRTNRIDIDYAHGVINLIDDDGKVITCAAIDKRLASSTVDNILTNILYGDGIIPDEVKMDIQSKGSDNKPVINIPETPEVIIPIEQSDNSCG